MPVMPATLGQVAGALMFVVIYVVVAADAILAAGLLNVVEFTLESILPVFLVAVTSIDVDTGTASSTNDPRADIADLRLPLHPRHRTGTGAAIPPEPVGAHLPARSKQCPRHALPALRRLTARTAGPTSPGRVTPGTRRMPYQGRSSCAAAKARQPAA
jgi:hypothetical protein